MKLTSQIKTRRRALGLQQKDMRLRIGMNQQQYQRIEAGGNPRLATLALVAEGLEAELLLVPKDKIRAVQAVLAGENGTMNALQIKDETTEDPWADLLD